MRFYVLAALAALAAFALGVLLGHATDGTTRVSAAHDATDVSVRRDEAVSDERLPRAVFMPERRTAASVLPHADAPSAPEARPADGTPAELPEDLLDALRRAIETGQVAEYERLYPGWLPRELFELYLGVGAIAEAQALSERFDLGPGARERIAKGLLATGDRASAAVLYRQLLEDNPWDSVAQNGLRSSDPTALVSVLEQLFASHPNDPALQLKLGNALTAVGRSGDALDHARRLLSVDPENSRAWELFSRIAPEEAEQWTREKATLDRDWTPYLADLLESRGATGEAVEVLKACLDVGFQEDAILQLTDLDPTAAAEILVRWSRQDPSNRELLAHLAEAQEAAELTADAIETWSRVLAADPEGRDSGAASALLWLDPDRFFDEVRPAVEASKEPRRWSELADWYRKASRMDEARAALDQAVELAPRDRRLREQRARLGQ